MKLRWIVLDHGPSVSVREGLPDETLGAHVLSGNHSATVIGVFESEDEARDCEAEALDYAEHQSDSSNGIRQPEYWQ